jgi:hypothetical protein
MQSYINTDSPHIQQVSLTEQLIFLYLALDLVEDLKQLLQGIVLSLVWT